MKILAFARTHQDFADIQAYAQVVLGEFGQKLNAILVQLRTQLPAAKIFVANQYPLPDIQAVLPITDQIVMAFNQVVAQVVAQVGSKVFLVDVYSAFLGRDNLVEGGRPGADFDEVHPTNVGHRVIEKAFAEVISREK